MTEWTEQTRQTCREALITKRTLSAEMADIMQRAAEVVPQDDRAIAVESYTEYVNEVAAIDAALAAIDAPQPPVQHIPDDVAACIELLLDNTTMDELTKTTVRIWMMRAEMNAPQPQPVADDNQWVNEVKDQIANASLPRASLEVIRLVNFALKTQHDEQFALEVDSCVKLFWSRCEREASQSPQPQPPMPADVHATFIDCLGEVRERLLREHAHDTGYGVPAIDAAYAWLDAHAQEGTK